MTFFSEPDYTPLAPPGQPDKHSSQNARSTWSTNPCSPNSTHCTSHKVKISDYILCSRKMLFLKSQTHINQNNYYEDINVKSTEYRISQLGYKLFKFILGALYMD